MAEVNKIPYIKRAWIEVEAREIDGKWRYKIKDFWAEHPFRLPKPYLDGYPHFYEINNETEMGYLAVIVKPYLRYTISRGDVLTKREFRQVIKAMREAGQRLTKIMKEKREKIHRKIYGQIKVYMGVGTYKIKI